ncbi:MAG: hypothetical protein DRN20_06355 [Thermoplasmata archaeon]|nr:MAG: hypothetical protein DRN20_06355 [Thermoplasmata archaeon]
MQGRFETGNHLEGVIDTIVQEVGEASEPQWRIVGQQMPTVDELLRKYEISGTIDGILQVKNDGKWVSLGVIDKKTASSHVFDSINCENDLNKYPWTAKYKAQVLLYTFAYNFDQGFLLFVRKDNLYDMKIITLDMDYEYIEQLLQKASKVNEAVRKGEPPPKINDIKICPKCPFYAYCAPELVMGQDIEMIDDKQIVALLDELEEIKEAVARAREIKKKLEELLPRGKDIVVGKYIITYSPSGRRKIEKVEE